jgi:hypothetical protein
MRHVTLGEISLDQHEQPQPLDNPLRPMLRQMVNCYRDIHGNNLRLFSIFYVSNYDLGEHKHDEYDVLNISIGGSKSHRMGTGWKNAQGQTLYTRENDLFHFKKGFPHLNPPLDIERYGERYAVAVTAG